MLWPKFGLPNLYCAFVERLCLGEVAALPISLFTNVFAILRSGCTKTQRSRAETGDATQPAISQALGPRKLVSQFFHDPRVEITTFDCKQTLVGNVAARYRISAAELHCAAFSYCL